MHWQVSVKAVQIVSSTVDAEDRLGRDKVDGVLSALSHVVS
jgi:hypothetical protein